ncbi:MAG: zinc-ribbon domain-containing protein [Chthonomonadales bacterium]|nr:zinc-ribbon domain-containing protein [Chthonomonadales bacterium]
MNDKPSDEKPDTADWERCPHCGEPLDPDEASDQCEHCGEEIGREPR